MRVLRFWKHLGLDAPVQPVECRAWITREVLSQGYREASLLQTPRRGATLAEVEQAQEIHKVSIAESRTVDETLDIGPLSALQIP